MYGLGDGVGWLHRMVFLIDTLFAAWVRLICSVVGIQDLFHTKSCRYFNVVIELEGVWL